MSDVKKPTDDARDDSIMSEEELESVSGGCQFGNETMYPKIGETILQIPPLIDPIAPSNTLA